MQKASQPRRSAASAPAGDSATVSAVSSDIPWLVLWAALAVPALPCSQCPAFVPACACDKDRLLSLIDPGQGHAGLFLRMPGPGEQNFFLRSVVGMFGIGSTEFLVIILVALLVLGPRNLAKVSRTVGKYMGEFRRISTDFQRTLNAEVAEEEREENREAVRKKVAKAKEARARRLAAEAAAGTQTAAAAQLAAAAAPAQTRAPVAAPAAQTAQEAAEPMVQPPAGSPLEAMLNKTAQEAAGGDIQNAGEKQSGGRA